MSAASVSVRVLVVDDHEMIADLLARILEKHGFESRAEYSAQAAMETAEAFDPDFLISDIVMPGMNGIELAQWFSEHRADCRILLTSANLQFDRAYLDFPKAERVGFLPKPVAVSDLIKFLQTGAITGEEA